MRRSGASGAVFGLPAHNGPSEFSKLADMVKTENLV